LPYRGNSKRHFPEPEERYFEIPLAVFGEKSARLQPRSPVVRKRQELCHRGGPVAELEQEIPAPLIGDR
jgi:hypothetical protein